MYEDDQPDRPFYRLQPCCFNCKYFKKKDHRMILHIGLCKIGEYQYPEAKQLPKNERHKYWVKTLTDAVCDNHTFKGRGILHRAYKTTGAQPLE